MKKEKVKKARDIIFICQITLLFFLLVLLLIGVIKSCQMAVDKEYFVPGNYTCDELMDKYNLCREKGKSNCDEVYTHEIIDCYGADLLEDVIALRNQTNNG